MAKIRATLTCRSVDLATIRWPYQSMMVSTRSAGGAWMPRIAPRRTMHIARNAHAWTPTLLYGPALMMLCRTRRWRRQHPGSAKRSAAMRMCVARVTSRRARQNGLLTLARRYMQTRGRVIRANCAGSTLKYDPRSLDSLDALVYASAVRWPMCILTCHSLFLYR